MQISKYIQAKRAFFYFFILYGVSANANRETDSRSVVDPVSQVYRVRDNDRIGQQTVWRTYSSGSIFRGHFGTGWCSELDGKISVFDGGDIRYRGCNIETADLIDMSTMSKEVRRTSSGFIRTREDGAKQFFSKEGYLDRIVNSGREIRIQRDKMFFPIYIVLKSKSQRSTFKVELESRRSDPAFVLIRSIGRRTTYEYREDLLVETGRDGHVSSEYNYDDQFNMVSRVTAFQREIIEYDNIKDRMISIEIIARERSAVFGGNRLLVAIERIEESDEIELKIQTERGAETPPVRILYNIKSKQISLQGDRLVARMILHWLRA